MRAITLSYSDIIGGAFRAAYRIHQSLLQVGVDSIIYAENPTSDDHTVYSKTGGLAHLSKYCRVRIERLLKNNLLQTNNSILHSPAFLPSSWPNKVNNSDVDIINLHWVNYEMLSIEDIGKIRKPTVWTLHDMWPFCGAEHYTNDNRFCEGYLPDNRPNHESGLDINRWCWNRKRKSWQRPLQIVTPSHWLAECAKQSVLMRDWPIAVIPNALDTTAWYPIAKDIAKRLLGFPEDTPLIAFGAMGGSRDTRKGSDLLFNALTHLRGQIPRLQLLVFGERRPTNIPNIGFPIHYLGHMYDELSLKIIYSAADAFVIPSRMDNLPTTGIEALACGTPVVAFDTCGLPDIVTHKKNGWLAKAFDTKDLALGIQWILENDERKQELSKQARIDAVARYSYPVVANIYKTLYQQVLNTNGK